MLELKPSATDPQTRAPPSTAKATECVFPDAILEGQF